MFKHYDRIGSTQVVAVCENAAGVTFLRLSPTEGIFWDLRIKPNETKEEIEARVEESVVMLKAGGEKALEFFRNMYSDLSDGLWLPKLSHRDWEARIKNG